MTATVDKVALALENSGLTYNHSSHRLAEIALEASAHAELVEALEQAFLVLSAALSPTERPLTPEEEQQVTRAVERCQRRIDRAAKPKRFEKYDRNTGSWMTEAEEFSQ